LPLDEDVDVAAVVFDVVLELDELPHALRATAVAPVRSKANTDLECLCTAPPPVKRLVFPAAQSNSHPLVRGVHWEGFARS
jgi:hypothetical protein